LGFNGWDEWVLNGMNDIITLVGSKAIIVSCRALNGNLAVAKVLEVTTLHPKN
jgi:hypothetical protein